MLDAREGFDPRELRDAFGQFPTGVTVVTLLNEEGCATGVTVSSFTSLSMDPALCLFSLGKNQISARWLKVGSPININVLSQENEAAAWQCARPSENKLSGLECLFGQNGVPVLANTLAIFECEISNIYDGGDHVILVARINKFQKSDGDPLIFFRGKMVSFD